MSNNKFGTYSNSDKDTEAQTNETENERVDTGTNTFGTKTNSVEFNQISSGWIKKMFLLQDRTFWGMAYGISLVLCIINGGFNFLGVLNLLLFPFSLILAGQLANRYFDIESLPYTFFSPDFQLNKQQRFTIEMVLWYIFKFLYFLILWNVSLIFGTIGVIMSVMTVKK